MSIINSTADELVINRIFDAPRALVFKAWTVPEHAMRWWGCEEFRGAHMEIDLQPGGAWRCCLKNGETGEERWLGGVFREIAEPERLSFTFAWELEGDWGRETIVFVTFAERDGKTHLHFRQQGFVSGDICDSHQLGWTSGFERLAAQLTENL
jgi:uncharacterized protein YndB with AHSA1/START domain